MEEITPQQIAFSVLNQLNGCKYFPDTIIRGGIYNCIKRHNPKLATTDNLGQTSYSTPIVQSIADESERLIGNALNILCRR